MWSVQLPALLGLPLPDCSTYASQTTEQVMAIFPPEGIHPATD
jgi:hypothetical protein